MSEQDNHLFKVIGSIVMGYGIDKPAQETLAIAQKIIDLVEKATEARIIKLLDEYPLPHWSPTEYIEYTEGYITGFQDALALIQGEELLGINPEYVELIKGKTEQYPLPLPIKTADNTEPAILSRPMKFKGKAE